jgi:Zn-dependent protease
VTQRRRILIGNIDAYGRRWVPRESVPLAVDTSSSLNPDFLVLGLLWYVVFLLSTTCHEAAHAAVAKWGGDLTAFEGGQVTLNPLPHIRRELFGMVIFPIITYAIGGWMMGWASAPYDPKWCREHPKRAARMALAGPAANFTLAILAGAAIRAGLYMQWFTVGSGDYSQVVDAAAPGVAEGLARFLSLLFSLNVLLGTFNLIPLPPLDGFNAIPVLLSENAGRRYLAWADSVRAYSIVGLIVSWQLFGRVVQPMVSLAVQTISR